MTEKLFSKRWSAGHRRHLLFPRSRLSRWPARWWLAVAAGVSVFVWGWWTAQSDRFAWLPVDILGQVLGDLLVAGLVLLPNVEARNRSSNDSERV
ncbi:hypothetical protein ACQPZF_25465 [Actinosynnema sp. CS-041913]|uniref:hypothetical protein n=1 Tax=Actinosynnema sp. CS-041913 TaxID=3239917 RepID=UPI003D8DCB44